MSGTDWQTADFLEPAWPAPAGVKALLSTRRGGASQPPWDSNNMALHVGDDPQAVAANRRALAQRAGWQQPPQWLEQVHGTRVVEAEADGWVRTADACFTTRRGLACTVLTADCLPVLLCDAAGSQVAAVHAGWRSLAGGILTASCERFSCSASDLLVYLGPAISQPHFEVGIDVLEAFFERAQTPEHCAAISDAFRPSPNRPLKFHADLYQLARAELTQRGVTRIFGGDACTFAEADRFYSFRRDGCTGRMVSAIWLE